MAGLPTTPAADLDSGDTRFEFFVQRFSRKFPGHVTFYTCFTLMVKFVNQPISRVVHAANASTKRVMTGCANSHWTLD